jgi:hypothetical protein
MVVPWVYAVLRDLELCAVENWSCLHAGQYHRRTDPLLITTCSRPSNTAKSHVYFAIYAPIQVGQKQYSGRSPETHSRLLAQRPVSGPKLHVPE